MPEVKWAFDAHLQDNKRDAYVLVKENAIPVLTLDAVEAWLKENVDATAPNGLHMCIDDLLAQVQAWKEGKA
jgi:hypothetical protein